MSFIRNFPKAIRAEFIDALYRKGYALKCMGQHVEALRAYSVGLAQDAKNRQLLAGFVECVQQSPLKERFCIVYEELKSLGYEKNAFVLISVIGQELLNVGDVDVAVEMLENALKIDTNNLELRQSTLSALSSAYWKSGSLKKAVQTMEQDLAIAFSLGNSASEMRARANLGMVHVAMGNLNEALNNYRHHLMLALRMNDKKSAASTLSMLGQIYSRLFDYANALSSFEQCLEMLRSTMATGVDVYQQYGYLGDIHLASGRDKEAEHYYEQHLSAATDAGDVNEQIRAITEIGSLCQFRGDTDGACRRYLSALKLARGVNERNAEMRLAGRLCEICISLRNYDAARRWAEKQLQFALVLHDPAGEAEACGNLGCIELRKGDAENAHKIFQRQLDVTKSISGDKRTVLSAYRNLGTCHDRSHRLRDAVDCHTSELRLAKEMNDKVSESMAHGRLASLYQKLSLEESDDRLMRSAETHLQCHWTLAKEFGNAKTESIALKNVGRFYIGADSHARSVEYFEKFLMLAQERNDVDAEKEACRELGSVHKALGRHREAARYFDQELSLAKDLRDHRTMARAYRDLGLERLALNELDEATECQKYFLALAHISHESELKLEALRNIGDVLMKRGKFSVALKIYVKTLSLAKACDSKSFEAASYGRIGDAYEAVGKTERARQCFAEYLRLATELSDVALECDAYGHLATYYAKRKNVSSAVAALECQLDRARLKRDINSESNSLKRLCDLCVENQMVDDALKYSQERIGLLKRKVSSVVGSRFASTLRSAMLDSARIYRMNDVVVEALKIYAEYFNDSNDQLLVEDEGEHDNVRSTAMLDFGRLWLRVGNFPRAFGVYEQVLSMVDPDATKLKFDANFGLLVCEIYLNNNNNAANRAKELLTFCRRNSLNLLEARVLLISAVASFKANGSMSNSLSLAKEAMSTAKRYDDVDAQCACLAFLIKLKEFQQDFGGASSMVRDLMDVAASRNIGKWKLIGFIQSAHFSMDNGDIDEACRLLLQALNLAVSMNNLMAEVEIRTTLALVNWQQNNLNEAKAELERAAKIVEKRSLYLNEDDFLNLFDEAALHLASNVYALLMLLSTFFANPSNDEQILMYAERCRYANFIRLFEQHGIDGRRRLSQPTATTLSERLSKTERHRCCILNYFQFEHFLFTWTFNDKNVKQFQLYQLTDFTETSQSNFDRFEFSTPFMRNFALNMLNAAISQLPVTSFSTCVQRDVDRFVIDCDQVILIGVAEKLQDSGSVAVTNNALTSLDFSLVNISVASNTIPTQLLAPGFVAIGCNVESVKGANAASSALHVECNRTAQLDKAEFLAKLTKSRYVHLNFDVDLQLGGFLLKNSSSSDANDDAYSVDDEESEEERCLSSEDVLKLNMRSAVVVLEPANVDKLCGSEFLTKFALCLKLAGCRTVLYLKTVGEKSTMFYESFYEALTSNGDAAAAILEACKTSKMSMGDVVVFGEGAGGEHVATRISHPFRLLLQTPDECREAMLVVLHLVEKSLQRINAGLSTPMFTSEQSVRNKSGPEVAGVFELLSALGFHREASKGSKLASNDETSLYFPLNDASGVLSRGSFILQSFLSLPQGMYVACSKLVKSDATSVAPILSMLARIEADFCTITQKMHKFEIKVARKLFSVSGVAEMFAALGFDKLSMDEQEVKLETIRIELTHKKLQNTLLCLREVFDESAAWMGAVESDYDRIDGQTHSGPSIARNSFSSSTSRLPLGSFNGGAVDLSGVDSDFHGDEGCFWNAMSLERPKSKNQKSKSGSSKWRKSNNKKLNGYMSEGDVKSAKSRRQIDDDRRGYHSEDEHNKSMTSSVLAVDDSSATDLAESTAQVISVDERGSPFDDLGFHDEDRARHSMVPSPPLIAPPPVPCNLPKHEYARLETPTPPAHGGGMSPIYSVRHVAHLESTPSSRPPSSVRLRPPSCRPPPPPYERHLIRNNASSPSVDRQSPIYVTSNSSSMGASDSAAEAMRRAAAKFVFQRPPLLNSPFDKNAPERNSLKQFGTVNENVDKRRVVNNSNHSNTSNTSVVFRHRMHDGRVLLAREDSIPAEFI